MKSLFEFEVLINEVFYKGWHILEYIENNKLTELDKEAIKATIMDALVTRNCINPETEFLNLEELSITSNNEDYHYNRTPNVCSIPLHIKDKLRKVCIKQSAGIPVTFFISKPPSKLSRYCVYDPNYAVSSIFDEVSFIECIYDSPTRPGIRLTESRPFIEVPINGELYLVDTITNRIFRSSWFRKTYNLETKDILRKSRFNKKQKKLYEDMTQEKYSIAEIIPFYQLTFNLPYQPSDMAEMKYEFEQTKILYPQEWERFEKQDKEWEEYKKTHNIHL